MKERLEKIIGWLRTPPIDDPIAHAEAKHGTAFLVKEEVAPWAKEISRRTTADFASVGRGYRRHCGPTAITNLILSLHHRYRFLPRPVSSREIFAVVSRIGTKSGMYWNTDILGRFGGTYDILTKVYIKACFRYYHIPTEQDPSGR